MVEQEKRDCNSGAFFPKIPDNGDNGITLCEKPSFQACAACNQGQPE